MIEIRRIRPSEADVLRAVRLAALTDAPAAFGSTIERELAFTDELWAERATASAAGDERTTFLAWDDSEPVGIVGGFRVPEHPGAVDLVSMWTHPSARSAGVGAALVQAVVDWSRDTGATRIELWVVRGNAPAQRLYERMGFRVTDDVQPHPNDPCAQEIRMLLPLT